MIARLFALGAVALGVAACGPQPNPQAPEYGLVNPNTGKLYPEYLDASYSLAPLYEQRMKRKLANSDRRAMDGALDAAFASAEGEGPHSWRSAATGRLTRRSRLASTAGASCAGFYNTAFFGFDHDLLGPAMAEALLHRRGLTP